VRSVLGTAKPHRVDPFVDKPGILSRAEVARVVDAAWESIVMDRAAAALEPSE